MTALRPRLLEIITDRGLLELDEEVELASGERSRYFVDAKRALSQGADLRLACEAILEVARARGIEFDAVGGLTLGADQFAHGVAVVGDKEWFVVRKEPKGRGTDQLVEGAELSAESRVLLVDDVVTTGGSIQRAFADIIRTCDAQVVLAVTVLDRGEVARAFFADQGVAYEPLLTYRDLGIPPVGATSEPPPHPAG